jgi:hypothetical protein
MANPSRWTPAGRQIPLADGASLGVSMLAGVLMFLVGTFHVLEGIAAIRDNGSPLFPPTDYSFDMDLTTWGWIHLCGGVVLALTGIGVLLGWSWAYVVGLCITVLSALSTFASLPMQPLWSLVILAFDALVLWALVTELAENG